MHDDMAQQDAKSLATVLIRKKNITILNILKSLIIFLYKYCES